MFITVVQWSFYLVLNFQCSAELFDSWFSNVNALCIFYIQLCLIPKFCSINVETFSRVFELCMLLPVSCSRIPDCSVPCVSCWVICVQRYLKIFECLTQYSRSDVNRVYFNNLTPQWTVWKRTFASTNYKVTG